METINFTVYAIDASKVDALKAFMKALKIKFDFSKQLKTAYNLEFVKKIHQGDEDLKNGKGRKVTLEEISNFII